MSAPIELVSSRGTSRRDETNHRIANQLTMMVSAIRVRASSIAKGPATIAREDVLTILDVIMGRLISLSELNRAFSQAGDEHTDVQKCLVQTGHALISALSLEDRVSLTHQLTADCVIDANQAQALALLINEIIINAVKHAHPTGLPVTITLSCDRIADGRIAIEVEDDGVGLPETFDAARDGGVGFKVIRTLAASLGAALEIQSDSLGLSFRFLLPPPNEAADGASISPIRATV